MPSAEQMSGPDIDYSAGSSKEEEHESSAEEKATLILSEVRPILQKMGDAQWQQLVDSGISDEDITIIKNLTKYMSGSESDMDLAKKMFDIFDGGLGEDGSPMSSEEIWQAIEVELASLQEMLKGATFTESDDAGDDKEEAEAEEEWVKGAKFTEDDLLNRQSMDKAHTSMREQLQDMPEDWVDAQLLFVTMEKRCASDEENAKADGAGFVPAELQRLMNAMKLDIKLEIVIYLTAKIDALDDSQSVKKDLQHILRRYKAGESLSGILGVKRPSAEATDPDATADPEPEAAPTGGTDYYGKPISAELWNNMEWRSRYEKNQLEDMWRRTPDDIKNGNDALRQLVAYIAKAPGNSADFWDQLDRSMPQEQRNMAGRVAKLQSLIQALNQQGVPMVGVEVEGPPVPDDVRQTAFEQQNKVDMKATLQKIEMDQIIYATEIQTLWAHLTDRQKTLLQASYPKLAGFTGDIAFLNDLIIRLRKDRADFNDNRPIHKAQGEVGQATFIKEELARIEATVFEMINEATPGKAGVLLDEAEISQRAQGIVPGRTGQSEKPGGQVVITKVDLDSIDSLSDKRKEFIDRQTTIKERREMDAVLKKFEVLPAATTVADIQKILDDSGYSRTSYEVLRSGHVNSRVQCQLPGGVVLEMISDGLGKMAFGLSNVEFPTKPVDVLRATDEGIERTNMSAFEGRYLLSDRMGHGTNVKLHLLTESDGVFAVYYDKKNGWMLEGSYGPGSPVIAPVHLSDTALEKFTWEKGVPVWPGLNDGQTLVKEIQLVYGGTESLSKQKDIKDKLAKTPSAPHLHKGNLGKELQSRRTKKGGRIRNFLAKS